MYVTYIIVSVEDTELAIREVIKHNVGAEMGKMKVSAELGAQLHGTTQLISNPGLPKFSIAV